MKERKIEIKKERIETNENVKPILFMTTRIKNELKQTNQRIQRRKSFDCPVCTRHWAFMKNLLMTMNDIAHNTKT